jgi:hypothetical protein
MTGMAQSQADPFTSLGVRQSTADRLRDVKPYESMSWDEFLAEMADTYEKEQR